MAVSTPVRTRPPALRHFARLRLRVLANGFRGRPWRIVMFVLGCLFGIEAAIIGFGLFALPAIEDDPEVALLVLGFGGSAIVLGWLFLPLVFFGVDDTFDPARLALLPLPRRTLVAGLLISGVLGVPAAATAAATSGSVVTAGVLGGWTAALVQAVGVAAGLLLCVTVSRAITSQFATLMRGRRTRDLAAVALAVFVALLGPLQVAVIAAASKADVHKAAAVARVLGWTPLGAPYTVGLDVAAGRPLAAAAKLVGTGLVLWLLFAWWTRSLESAMVGASASAARPARATRDGDSPVAQLLPRLIWWLRPGRHGALVAREARYWWRDARRRANLITLAVVGVFLPLMSQLGSADATGGRPSPFAVTLPMLFVGALGAVALANQFGFDGSAYAAHLVVGVPGRVELRTRVTGYSVYIVPLLTAIAVVVAVAVGDPGRLPPMLGALYAAYGTGLAVNLFVSVLAPYSLPETSNPFAITSGAGVAKSMLSLAALVGSLAICVPYLLGAALLGSVWTWVALPAGVLYGAGAAVLGCYLAGDVLDRRAPELLAAVTPRG